MWIFEYILAGIPVIASDLPEMKNIFNKYKIGYCVPHNNIQKQVKAVNKILNGNFSNVQNIALEEFVWENQDKELKRP